MSGGSAGGHLSALLALTPGDADFQPGFESADASVDACVPFYGVYDMTAGRGTSGYDAGLLSLLERRVFKRRIADDPGTFEVGIAPVPGERRRTAVLRGPRHQRHPRPGGRSPGFRARPAGRVQVARALRRASLHPTRLRRASRPFGAPTRWPRWCASSKEARSRPFRRSCGTAFRDAPGVLAGTPGAGPGHRRPKRSLGRVRNDGRRRHYP